MLKLLLSHWQSHREPLPFVLTDDPLYCSHLTKSPFPEVYSVNRINPIFEEDEEKSSNNTSSQFQGQPYDTGKNKENLRNHFTIRRGSILKPEKNSYVSTNFLLKPSSNKAITSDIEYSSGPHFNEYTHFEQNSINPFSLKRSLSEERRENETKSSDDTGYSSSGQFKSLTTLDSDGSVENHPMSSDSDDCSRPEAVIVSADVHRVSTPADVIVRSPSSDSSANFSYRSYGSSPEPFDSLTMSSGTNSSIREMDPRKPNSVVREKLQKLLEKGNPKVSDENRSADSKELEIQKTKSDLMKSLTRALNNKVPKRDVEEEQVVTRSDDTNTIPQTIDRRSNSSSTSPKTLILNSESVGVTRQDESNASTSSSFAKLKSHHHRGSRSHSKSTEKEESSDSQTSSHKCKLCENAHRPLAFHQLLPGHWSYDNVYLPQMHGMLCPCVHHGVSVPPSSDDDAFYPMFYHHDASRLRHSWAPYSNGRSLKGEDKSTSTSGKENLSSGTRCPPDGETDSSNTETSQMKKSLQERRSLREPKRCKCDHCLDTFLDKTSGHHNCTCYCLSHRRVKFASDSDISQHKHLHSFSMKNGLPSGEKINAALVMNLPHMNGHVANKGNAKENGKLKKGAPLVSRGLKEPVKMDEFYQTYPINFRDWEAHYRRNFLQKRKKRALTMIGMAIGIILVVGIAVALTFVFLRIRRPAS